MKQHLREAELELNRKRAQAEALEEEQRRLTEEAERLEGEVRALDEDVELALAGGKEELARFAVRRLLPKRKAAVALRTRTEEIAGDRERIAERLESQQQEFEELRRRVRTFLAAQHRDETGRAFPDEATVADAEVELELLRRASGAAPARGEER
jgi:phage shock protein A